MFYSNPKDDHKCKSGRLTAALAMVVLLTTQPVRAQEFNDMIQFVDLMNEFFVLMDSMYAAASNPEHAALLQMNSLEDIYKETGNLREMLDVYREVINKSWNATVRRLARMRLADALKESGQKGEAIEVLREAIDESAQQANRQDQRLGKNRRRG